MNKLAEVMLSKLGVRLVGKLDNATGFTELEADIVLDVLQDFWGLQGMYNMGVIEVEFLGFPLYVQGVQVLTSDHELTLVGSIGNVI
jgi:hypothetical protein